jgi:hypothetical protein
MTESTGAHRPRPTKIIAVPVANVAAEDRAKLADLFAATAEIFQPIFHDGQAEAKAGFLRALSAALRESIDEEWHSFAGMTAPNDVHEFYGDGDPDSSS